MVGRATVRYFQSIALHEIRSLAYRLYKCQGIDVKTLPGHKTDTMPAIYSNRRGGQWVTLKLESATIFHIQLQPLHPIEISEEAGVRSLHFGSDWVQGAMRMRSPYALELAYTREMMACLLLRDDADWPRRALLIGLGAGSLAKFMHRHLAQTTLTAVDIDPRIPRMARLHFHLPDDPRRLKIVIADGAEYVEGRRRKFDLVLVDGFGPDARPGRLDTVDFYANCAGLLNQTGLLVCNLLGRSRGFAASVARINKAFAGRSMVFPSCDSGNAIAFGVSGEEVRLTLAEMKTRALALKAATGLDLRPTISRLQQAHSLPQGQLIL